MTINVKVEKHIYKFYSILLFFFYIYLEVHCQVCQNNPLSTDPFSYLYARIVINDKFGIISQMTKIFLILTVQHILSLFHHSSKKTLFYHSSQITTLPKLFLDLPNGP
jgi:hypothetical protein